MNKIKSYFLKATTLKLWVLAHLIFWISNLLVLFIDYTAAKWFGHPGLITITKGSLILFYSGLLFIILSIICLICSGVKYYINNKGLKGFILALLYVLFTGFVNYIINAILWLWYVINLMQYDSL